MSIDKAEKREKGMVEKKPVGSVLEMTHMCNFCLRVSMEKLREGQELHFIVDLIFYA